MGCTSSHPVAPDSARSEAPAASTGGDTSTTPRNDGQPHAASSALANVSSVITAENAVQFADEASGVLETLSAAPDVVANFSQFLQDHAGDLRDALGAIAGTAVQFASVRRGGGLLWRM
jgi:uncharacterized phage infection (PIP) family protein YhgE